MEISKDGSLDKTLLYLIKLTLTLINLWKFPNTDLDETLLGFTEIDLSTGKFMKFSKTDVDKTLLYLLKLTLKHSGKSIENSKDRSR